MIVGACGFGSTGSSVISDYLSEYPNVAVLDELEFGIVHDLDGMIDLESHVMHPQNRTSGSIVAINRFMSYITSVAKEYESLCGIKSEVFINRAKDFLESITHVKWYWYDFEPDKNLFDRYFKTAIMKHRFIPRIEKKIGRQIRCYPMKEVALSIMPDNFYELAKGYIADVLRLMGADFQNPITVLDQPFSGNNPQVCFPFFDDPYAVVVDRDPRDNYVFAKTKLIGRNHFMAVDPVEDFVKYYKCIRRNQPYLNGDKRVITYHFEDFVYDYDNTTAKLNSFLGLGKNPNPKSIFDPSLSIANTQVYKRYPEYKSDIEYIEKNLEEYLFDFEKYGPISITGEMFFGKSPLNRK